MAEDHTIDPHPPLTPAPGILLINSGTPQSPTPAALRDYHAEFLSDPRVIDWPRWFWLPLLHLVILRSSPKTVARKYAKPFRALFNWQRRQNATSSAYY